MFSLWKNPGVDKAPYIQSGFTQGEPRKSSKKWPNFTFDSLGAKWVHKWVLWKAETPESL